MSTIPSAATAAAPISISRLVLAPSLITLGVTLVRLTGELQDWPEPFFNRTMGAAIVGITWLPPFVGIYFAMKLAKSGNEPNSFLSSIGYSLLGVMVLLACAFAPTALGVEHGFYDRLLYGWGFFVVSALLTFRGWPQLWKALLAYGFAARIPVAVIGFFAFRGEWGTHYDAVPADLPALSVMEHYLWLGLFPQLTLWVAITILAGILFGTVISGIARLVQIDRGVPV